MAKEFKVPRSVNEINTDFTRLAVRLGDLTFRIKEQEKDAALLQEQMRELNFEAMAAHRVAKEAEEKAKIEAQEAAKLAPKEEAVSA